VELSHHLLSKVLAHGVSVGKVPAGATYARCRSHALVLCETIQYECLTSSYAVRCFSCYLLAACVVMKGHRASLHWSKVGVILTGQHSPHVQVHLGLQNEPNKQMTNSSAVTYKGLSFSRTCMQTASC
jgi:hypothetical protein